MQWLIDKIEKNKIIYFFSILLISNMVIKRYVEILFDNTTVSINTKVFLMASVFISCILITINRKTYKFGHIAFLIIIVFQYLLTGNGVVLFSIICAMALKQIHFDKVIKIYFITNLICFSAVILLWILGIKTSMELHYAIELGFGNPNTAYISFFLIWISYLYLRFDKLNIVDYMLLIIMPIFMYDLTKSRTGLLTIFISLVVVFIYKIIEKDNHSIYLKIKILLNKIMIVAPILITLATLIVSYVFGKHEKLNTLLSSRPYCWNLYLSHKEKPLSFIGYDNNMRWSLFQHDVPMDSGYVAGMYMNGVIIFSLIIILYMISIHILAKHNCIKSIIYIFAILIYSFAESITLEISTNITLVFMIIPFDFIKLKKRILISRYKKTCKHENLLINNID